MTELEIKAAVLQHVRRAAGRKKKPIVASEFCLGTSAVRADLALLADEFIGIEIKSPRDSLRRLVLQLQAYARYFDRVVLIVAEKHIRAALEFDLVGAALWTVDDKGQVEEIRRAHPNTVRSKPSYPDLLTQAETRRFVNKVPAEVPIEHALKQALHQAFAARYGETSDEFWREVARRPILATDLKILSRYEKQRALNRELIRERDDFWKEWRDQARKEISLPNLPQSRKLLQDHHSSSEPEDGY